MRFHFPFATFASGVIFAGAIAGVVYWIVEDSSSAMHRYHELLQLTNPINSRKDSSSYTAKQKREGIQKSFYFIPSKGRARQELRLFASQSELAMNRGETSEISEKLDDLRLFVQESLYYQTPEGKESFEMTEGSTPMQKITYLEGDTADCDYTNGKVEAHRAEITRFTLFGHTLINTIQEGNIDPYQSASAEKISLSTQNGLLELNGNVSIDHHQNKDLLQLTSNEARLYEENKSPVIEAKQNVTLVFNNHFTVLGEFAKFVQNSVTVLGGPKKCRLSSVDGDLIISDRINVSLASKVLEMENPIGELYPAKNEPTALTFNSKHLLWDHEQNQLILDDQVNIFHPELGNLSNHDVVHVFRGEGKGKRSLQKIISEGTTTLQREDQQTLRHYTLVCIGQVILDHAKGHVELTAYDPSQKQVHLKDEFGEIFSDSAEIFYVSAQSRQAIPQKIILKGNVKIINRDTLADDTVGVMQMALADRVELNPSNNEMTFYANRKKRVLFYDRGNDLQVSAPKLKIKRDQKTKKESFEGTGDVRFSFQDKEIAQLRKKFSLPFNLK